MRRISHDCSREAYTWGPSRPAAKPRVATVWPWPRASSKASAVVSGARAWKGKGRVFSSHSRPAGRKGQRRAGAYSRIEDCDPATIQDQRYSRIAVAVDGAFEREPLIRLRHLLPSTEGRRVSRHTSFSPARGGEGAEGG